MSIADYGLDPDNLNQRTIYAYDRLSRKASITAYADPTVAQTTSYDHDDINNKLTITYPDNTEMEYEYYANGAVKTRTNQNGWLTTYAYDTVGNMETKATTKTSMPTVVESYTYDPLNRMASANKLDDSTQISYTEFSYNDMGMLDYTTDAYFAGTAKKTDYEYDQAGYRTEIDYPYPDGGSATTSFDITPDYLGRIGTINDGAADVVTYSYIGDRVAKRSYPTTTPVNANYEYDNFGRVTDIYTTNATARDSKVDFNLAYKPNTSSIEEITFNHRSPTTPPSNDFSYDNLNRLTDVEYLDNANDTEAFAMDLLGNRESVTIDGGTPETYAVNDTTNRYNESIGSYTITLGYDTAGNTTTDQNGYQYSYDYDNHITEIKDNLSALVATFIYDALGRSIERYDAKAAVTTRYYYDNNRVLLEVEDSGSGFADARYFVYGNYIDEVLIMTDVDSGNSVTDGDYYYGHDQLFSPVALFDDTGSVKERYEYDAYGKTTVMNSTFTDIGTSIYANPYLFTGRRLDILDNSSLKIYYYRARNYDPDTGRFLQHDPAGYIDGMNLYQYVSSNPAMYVDPMGLFESLYESQPWLDRYRFEHDMVGGRFGISEDRQRTMQKYYDNYDEAKNREAFLKAQGEQRNKFEVIKDNLKGCACVTGEVWIVFTIEAPQQAILNGANQVQNNAIDVANFGISYHNGIHTLSGWLVGFMGGRSDPTWTPVNHISKSEWSRNAVMYETDFTHKASSFLMGSVMEEAATAGLGKLFIVLKGATKLDDVAKGAKAAKCLKEAAEGAIGKADDVGRAASKAGRTASPDRFIVDPKGNVIPLRKGEYFTSSPDGKWIQVRDASGKPTGLRIDGPHNINTHSDPSSLMPHGHVPGVTNPDGTPWLPVKK